MGSEESSGQQSSKCGSWTSSIGIPWALLERQTLCSPPSPLNQTLGVWGPASWVNKRSR